MKNAKFIFLILSIFVITSCEKKLEDNEPSKNTSYTSSKKSAAVVQDLQWMVDLIDKERKIDPKQAIILCDKLIEIALTANNREGEALGYFKKAFTYDQYLGEYGDALPNYFSALTFYKELGINNAVNECLLGMGGVYYKLGEFNKALSYYQKLLQNAEQANNKVDQGKAYEAIALCYRELNENVNHIVLFYKKSLQIREEFHDEVGIADCYNGIANTYYDLTDDYKKAKGYFLKSLEIQKNNTDDKLADTYYSLGLVHKELKEEKIAMEYFGKALQVAEEINYSNIIIRSRKQFGLFYLNKKDYTGAIAELQEAEKIAQQSNDFILLEEINQLLSVCYKETENIHKALSYSEATLKMKSINSNNELMATIKRNVQLVEVGKFETSLKKSSTTGIGCEWIVLISIGGISLMAFLIWGVRSRREKELIAIIEENEERIDELKFTLMDTAQHMFNQSIELGDLRDRYNEIIDALNTRNGDEGFLDLINPN